LNGKTDLRKLSDESREALIWTAMRLLKKGISRMKWQRPWAAIRERSAIGEGAIKKRGCIVLNQRSVGAGKGKNGD
jgi:hypothetical protein